MDYKKLVALISLSTLMPGCSDKVVLDGERQELTLKAKTIIADPGAQKDKVALSVPLNLKNWSMQGYNETYTVPHVQFSNTFSKVTSFNGGKGESSGKQLLYAPLIQNGRLYMVDTEGVVRCYDLATESLVWSKDYVLTNPAKRTLSVSGMNIYGDMGFLSLSSDQGIAISLKDGAVIWKQQLSDIARIPPRAYKDTVYFTNIDNMLEARDLKTGAVKWTHQSVQEEAILLGGSNVSVTAKQVVAPFVAGEIAAFNHAGTQQWSDQFSSATQGNIISSIQHVYAPAVIDSGVIYASSHAGNFIAYNVNTGRRIWEQPILALQTPAVENSHLFMLDNQQRMMCIKKSSGQVKWVQQLKIAEEDFSVSEAPIYWYGPIMMSGKLAVFGSNGTVLLMNPDTGIIEKTIVLDYQIAMAPIVVDGRCYIVTPNNNIIVYE